MNRHFQAKRAKYSNCCIFKTQFLALYDVDIALTNFRCKIGEIVRPTFFVALANGLEYRNADKRVNRRINWPTSYRNLMRFGALGLIDEFTDVYNRCVYRKHEL